MISLLAGSKGGTGKTTLATNLAVEASARGKQILLLDADPQGSVSAWIEQRSEVCAYPIIHSVQKYGRGIANEVSRNLAKRYDHIIIDTGGHDSIEMRMAGLCANQVIIPIQPSQFDVWTIKHMMKILDEWHLLNPELSGAFVINRAPTNYKAKSLKEIRDLLADENIPTLQTVVYERDIYKRAAKNGKGVVEMHSEDNKKACNEIKDLFSEIFGLDA